jgi:hypothetical protein
MEPNVEPLWAKPVQSSERELKSINQKVQSMSVASKPSSELTAYSTDTAAFRRNFTQLARIYSLAPPGTDCSPTIPLK